MQVKLFPNFTRHHLITHTNLVRIVRITDVSLTCCKFFVYGCRIYMWLMAN